MVIQGALTPHVEIACVVCGNGEHAIVASAAEVKAQHAYLHRFHRRRVRPGTSADALGERAEFTQDYDTNVVVCTLCGQLFRDPRPPAVAIATAYRQDRYGSERLQALFESQLELFRPKARRLRRWLGDRSDPFVVEIGSFVGGFLAAAREQGWRVVGIDPGQEVAAFCAQQGLLVLPETVETSGLYQNAADCVAIWNTLDQLPAPQPTLAAVQLLLRPGGILALRVPNGACFGRAAQWLRQWPAPWRSCLRAAMAWNNLLAFPYLQGYSVATLDRLLAPYGLQRVAFAPDVLTRLADAHTKPWAAWEERLLKALWRAAAAADARTEPRGAGIAPWFDAYYQLTGPRSKATATRPLTSE